MKKIYVIILIMLPYLLIGESKTADEQIILPKSIATITPIFSQIVMVTIPTNFNLSLDYEHQSENSYIQERVLKGESVDNWSQIITVTGAKDLSLDKSVSTDNTLGLIASRFQSSCPNTFSSIKLKDDIVKNHESMSVVISCGNLNNKSETALITAVKGHKDFYTIQWAEHGKSSSKPINIDRNKWLEKLKSMNIKIIVKSK